MEQFIRAGFNSQNLPLYNCSQHSSEYWTEYTGVKHPFVAYYSWTLGTISMLCYIPCIFAMLSKNLYRHSAYKIMVYLSIVDVCGITTSCFFFGYFMYHGYVFCTSPDVIPLVFRMFDLLVVDRQPFGGDLLTNADESAVSGYVDYKQHFNNFFFGVGNVVLYALLYLLFHNKFSEYFNETGNRRDKYMFVQVVIIACLNIIVCFLYILLLYFHMPSVITLIAHTTYQMIHCSPSFIYLLMNKSIRQEIGKIFCGRINGGRASNKVGTGSLYPGRTITSSTNDKNSIHARELTHSSPSQIYHFA
ncbi:hypothetical protein WR25_25229 [Diploscapter pachys]|uniref:G-protein coupled receptors family 1 profile domain-containing protein n=1 Tax=Diploscapter pachys TaxID=2018661 RepID=A0A2A2KF32_9BILA|nr:hypothetical protein WR25_25229 [Diploscapter pachys]